MNFDTYQHLGKSNKNAMIRFIARRNTVVMTWIDLFRVNGAEEIVIENLS